MIPEHYSREIVQRCSSLIRHLGPVVQSGLGDDEQFGGPLYTTFLLSMATPMIVLPIERLFKPGRPNADQAADDRQLNPALTQAVVDTLGPGRRFDKAPFVVPGRWSYVVDCQPFNVANIWPMQLLERLSTEDARTDANNAAASAVLLHLRNAMAHGGIAYLNEDGRQSGGDAAMLAFASARLMRGSHDKNFSILRIRQDDFYNFLMAWAGWLEQPELRRAFSWDDPLVA